MKISSLTSLEESITQVRAATTTRRAMIPIEKVVEAIEEEEETKDKEVAMETDIRAKSTSITMTQK
jgi:hypothetical protein